MCVQEDSLNLDKIERHLWKGWGAFAARCRQGSSSEDFPMETEPKPRMLCVVSTHMQLQMLSIVCVKVNTGEGKTLIAIT